MVEPDRQEVPRVVLAARELERSCRASSLSEMRGRRSASFDSMIALARQAGDLVELLGHRDAFDDVAELHDAGDLGEDRHRERDPTRRGAGPP